MSQPKLYLAGPDVFLREAKAVGERKKGLCQAYGLIGLHPLDNELSKSADIYAANVAMIRDADGAIVNLTPFRGPSADAGTIFELGMLVALGKPVFAYSNTVGTLLERTRTQHASRFDAATHTWRDAADMLVEDFALADNLMIDESFAILGRRIHRRDVAAPETFTDLGGFVACLDEAKAFYAA